MKTLTFWRLCGGLLLSAGCAESAISSTPEPSDEEDAGATSEGSGMDAGTSVEPVSVQDEQRLRDASVRRDAASPNSGDAASRDAAAKLDAGNDASSDAQIADANAGPPSFNAPPGCAKKTLGSRGYAFCSETRSWSEARSMCLGAGLDLAIVTDPPENDFVRTNGTSWIAVNDQTNEGSYVQVVPGNRSRVDGAPVMFSAWAAGEPNDSVKCSGFSINGVCLGLQSDEDCVLLNADGSWNDVNCGELNAYVCETL